MRDMEKRRESNRRYAQSARGKAKQRISEKRYRESSKGTLRQKRYEGSLKGLLKYERYRNKVSSRVGMALEYLESGETTFEDLEHLIGRELYSDEKDWWTIVKWTGADKFLRPKICKKSPSSSCSWRLLPA
jgi:predicted DNA binding protein